MPLDMLQQYTRAALNIIGRAGFNYDFERNRDKDGNNPLSSALNSLFNILVESKVLALTMQMLPVVLDLVRPTSQPVYATDLPSQASPGAASAPRATHLTACPP